MYADASSHYPKNQEILTHLFMAYVRLGDYQKQQHTAIQLHQAFPESGPYYCWRVMSILMQVCTFHDSPPFSLSLACRWCQNVGANIVWCEIVGGPGCLLDLKSHPNPFHSKPLPVYSETPF